MYYSFIAIYSADMLATLIGKSNCLAFWNVYTLYRYLMHVYQQQQKELKNNNFTVQNWQLHNLDDFLKTYICYCFTNKYINFFVECCSWVGQNDSWLLFFKLRHSGLVHNECQKQGCDTGLSVCYDCNLEPTVKIIYQLIQQQLTSKCFEKKKKMTNSDRKFIFGHMRFLYVISQYEFVSQNWHVMWHCNYATLVHTWCIRQHHYTRTHCMHNSMLV